MRAWSRLPKALILFMILGSIVLNPSAQAFQPLRNISEVRNAEPEDVLHVATAKVVFADYALIRKDFPEVRRYTNNKIDAWLIRNAAIISKAQAAQQVVNTEIKTTGRVSKATRPPEYKRAHVKEVDTGGLFDIKGTGSVDPSTKFGRNGLATLGEMIREYLYSNLVSRIFGKTGRFDNVKCYAVLDLGFNVKLDDGTETPAGVVIRQVANRHGETSVGTDREFEDPAVLPREHQLEVELTLRQFGVTSAIHLFPGMYNLKFEVDQMNLQGTEDGSVIDYGSFRVRSHFDRPIYYTYDIHGNANITEADVAVPVDSPHFIQPNPALAIPTQMWGNWAAHGEQDNPDVWSRHFADAWRQGRVTRREAEQHFRNFMKPVDEKLSPIGLCSQVFH